MYYLYNIPILDGVIWCILYGRVLCGESWGWWYNMGRCYSMSGGYNMGSIIIWVVVLWVFAGGVIGVGVVCVLNRWFYA